MLCILRCFSAHHGCKKKKVVAQWLSQGFKPPAPPSSYCWTLLLCSRGAVLWLTPAQLSGKLEYAKKLILMLCNVYVTYKGVFLRKW